MNIALARLTGFCISLALSVAYTGLFAVSVYVLRRRSKTSDISRVITAALVFLFLLNAAQLYTSSSCRYLFRWTGSDGPTGYFLDYGSKILPARDCIFWVEGIITDTVVCWRLYVIWLKRKSIMILPVAVLIGGLVSGVIMFFYTIERMVQDSTTLIPVVDKWWEITLGFTIATNILVPVLICGRLWHIARKVGVLGSDSVRPYKEIALALMESGALYTIAVTGHLIIFLTGSLSALYMAACILPTIIAIVPTLIVLRVEAFKHSHITEDMTGAPRAARRGGAGGPVGTPVATTGSVALTETRPYERSSQSTPRTMAGSTGETWSSQDDSLYVRSKWTEGFAGDDAGEDSPFKGDAIVLDAVDTLTSMPKHDLA